MRGEGALWGGGGRWGARIKNSVRRQNMATAKRGCDRGRGWHVPDKVDVALALDGEGDLVIESIDQSQSGSFFNFDGKELPW